MQGSHRQNQQHDTAHQASGRLVEEHHQGRGPQADHHQGCQPGQAEFYQPRKRRSQGRTQGHRQKQHPHP